MFLDFLFVAVGFAGMVILGVFSLKPFEPPFLAPIFFFALIFIGGMRTFELLEEIRDELKEVRALK